MNADIQPNYQPVQVTCGCGHTFKTRSTLGRETLHVDVCSACHPFYTGKQKVLDTEGRVERFMKRYGGSAGANKASDASADSAEK